MSDQNRIWNACAKAAFAIDAGPGYTHRVELELHLSLFREGLFRGLREGLGYPASTYSGEQRLDAEPAWSDGYQAGVKMAEEALEAYRNKLEGR